MTGTSGADAPSAGTAQPHPLPDQASGAAGTPWKTGRSKRLPAALIIAGCCAILVFTALGLWQLQRRTWKLALIQQVEERVHAASVAAPGPSDWPAITARNSEYRRVAVSGRFLNDRETLVRAVTERGAGFWVITPMVTDWGFTVLVNRGFVPSGKRDPASRLDGQTAEETAVAGLMRMSEPGGGLLRANDPDRGRWYSRDVAAIAATRSLGPVAPYFVDADSTPNPGGLPVGGLTVIAFANNHLVYALTWFAMALLLGIALCRLQQK